MVVQGDSGKIIDVVRRKLNRQPYINGVARALELTKGAVGRK